MHLDSTMPVATHEGADVDSLLATLPLRGQLRRATQAHAMLAYARTSKTIQTTTDAQHERILAMAKRYNVPVTQKRQDKGKSGWRSDREQYQAVLADLASGEYSHLGLYKADRLARDSVELISTVRACWAMGITVLDTTVGELTPQNLHLLAMLAENELRTLSERTLMGLEDKAKDRKLGRGRVGYKRAMTRAIVDGQEVMVPVKGQWVPDEDGAAPVIRELGQRFASGEGLMALTRWYNEKMGTTHTYHYIRRVLSCEYYAGWVVNRKENKSILNERAHARPKEQWTRPWRHAYPLWDDQTWTAIQARLGLAAHVGQVRAAQPRFALQGIVWCANCQRRMAGQDKGTDGKSYRCVRCSFGRGLPKCEGAVRSALLRLPIDSEHAAAVLAENMDGQRGELECQLTDVGAQRKALHLKRMRAYDRWDEGRIDQEQYNDQVAAIDGAIAELARHEQALQAQLAAQPQNRALVAQIAERKAEWLRWPDKIGAMAIEDQQRVYRECCKRVVLDKAANTLTVEYADHIALLIGESSHTVAL